MKPNIKVEETARAYSMSIVELTNRILNENPPYKLFDGDEDKAMVMVNMFNGLAVHFISSLIMEIIEDISNEKGGATEMLKLLQKEYNNIFQSALDGTFDELICTKKLNTPTPDKTH